MTGVQSSEFDLAIRSQVEIEASPAEVWPWLARPKEWKSSVVSIERIAGEEDGEGETLRIGQRPGDVTVYVIMRTVRAEFPVWKVQTLQTEGENHIDGYVNYSLERTVTGTRLRCEVLARCRVPRPPGEVGHPVSFACAVNESTRAKLEADHLVLKRLVEGSTG